MRPRVFPAEDLPLGRAVCDRRERASMRPRVFPAEDTLDVPETTVRNIASMRPRVFPAEDGVRDYDIGSKRVLQ